jgi:hypothetical protein
MFVASINPRQCVFLQPYIGSLNPARGILRRLPGEKSFGSESEITACSLFQLAPRQLRYDVCYIDVKRIDSWPRTS